MLETPRLQGEGRLVFHERRSKITEKKDEDRVKLHAYKASSFSLDV
jgi:hypothetical protein